jgi:hypothetical protein
MVAKPGAPDATIGSVITGEEKHRVLPNSQCIQLLKNAADDYVRVSHHASHTIQHR